jgi:hypothetical protein
MSNIVKQLKQAANCAPLWKNLFESAASEIERLQDCCACSLDKGKANAVREAASAVSALLDDLSGHNEYVQPIKDIADEIERGD